MQTQQALKIFHEMPQQTVTPNAITYKAIISACKKGHQHDEAQRLSQEMDRRGVWNWPLTP